MGYLRDLLWVCWQTWKSAELLGLSPTSKWQFQQILLQHARGNSQRCRFAIFCNILFWRCVYDKSLSVFFSAEPQLANIFGIYFDVQCYAMHYV